MLDFNCFGKESINQLYWMRNSLLMRIELRTCWSATLPDRASQLAARPFACYDCIVRNKSASSIVLKWSGPIPSFVAVKKTSFPLSIAYLYILIYFCNSLNDCLLRFSRFWSLSFPAGHILLANLWIHYNITRPISIVVSSYIPKLSGVIESSYLGSIRRLESNL